MLIDATIFYNEFDMLDVRLEYLGEYIDMFYIIESDRTFTGNYKGFKLQKYINGKWAKISNKIIIYENSEYLTKENFYSNSMAGDQIFVKQLESLVAGLIHDKNINTWINDFFQRELIKKLENHISESDCVFVSDIDEIINLDSIKKIHSNRINYFDQLYYKFWITFKQDIEWKKVYCCKWNVIMEQGVNSLRILCQQEKKSVNLIAEGGWHFTSFGGGDVFLAKLKNWGHQEYNTVLGRAIAKFRFKRGMDPFGSGDIIAYSEPNIDPVLKNLLCSRFRYNFISPSRFDKVIHYLAIFLEKVYRRLFC
jgi:beta-1,4-mannosyl-glycoprotein beta-1,4-N-acetylglucosaminyltransferase